MGAGLVVAIDTAGRFALSGLERDGRPLLSLTPDETRLLFRFWLPICAQAVMQQIALTVAERIEVKGKESAAPPEPEPEEQHAIRPQRLELLAAPNCDASVLTFPPRVVTVDGTQFVELKGYDGWDGERYPVLEVTRMDAHEGLVLVATPEQVFIMTATDYEDPIE